MRAARLAALVAVAALLAGCDGQPQPSSSSATTPRDEPAPSGAVTANTAGKPVLRLRMGQPVVYNQGVVTLTITGDSVERADPYPPEFEERTPYCDSFWAGRFTVRIQAPAHWNDSSNWLAHEWAGLVYPVESFELDKDGKPPLFGDLMHGYKGTDNFSEQFLHSAIAIKDDAAYERTYRAVMYTAACGDQRANRAESRPTGVVGEPVGLATYIHTPADLARNADLVSTIAVWTR